MNVTPRDPFRLVPFARLNPRAEASSSAKPSTKCASASINGASSTPLQLIAGVQFEGFNLVGGILVHSPRHGLDERELLSNRFFEELRNPNELRKNSQPICRAIGDAACQVVALPVGARSG
jgi:hypothetical protein